MANIHSQKKRILRAERERLENRRYTSTIRTFFRRLEATVASGDETAAAEEHRILVRTIDKIQMSEPMPLDYDPPSKNGSEPLEGTGSPTAKRTPIRGSARRWRTSRFSCTAPWRPREWSA